MKQNMILSRYITDSLKGIAVILIFICHFIGGGYGIRYLTPLGGIGVAVFLFLSGYGLNESYKNNNLEGYWGKKVIKVFLPYFIWCLILLLLNFVTSYEFTFFPRYWYLEYLWLWYFVFWLSKRYFPEKSVILMFLITIALFPFMRNIQTEQSLSFLLGLIVSEQNVKISRWSYKRLLFLLIFFFSLATICLGLKQIDFFRNFGEESIVVKLLQLGTKLPYALVIVIFVILFFKDNGILLKPLVLVGSISLELYLVQMQFYGYVQHSFVNLVILILVTIVMSYLLKLCSTSTQRKIKCMITFREQRLK